MNRCLYCGLEISDGDFCIDHDIDKNTQLLKLFSNISALKIKGWEYDFFNSYLTLDNYSTMIIKAPRGAYKSTVADLIVLLNCELYTDIEILIASVSFPVALQHIRNIKNMIINSNIFGDLSHNELFVEDSKQQFELSTGVRVFAIPQSEKTQVGYHPDLKIVDELARMKPDFYYSAIFPMGRSKESEMDVREIIISTGFGSSGAFGDILKGKDESVYKLDVSIDSCWWLKDKLDVERARMPELLFRQEMLGELVDDADKVFSSESIYSSFIGLPKMSGNYIMGVDLGRKIDMTAIVIVDLSYNNIVYIETLNDPIYKTSWKSQVNRIISIAKEWKIKDVYVDATGLGDVVYEQLSELHPVGIVWTNSKKNEAIQKIQLLLESNLHSENGLKIPSEFTSIIDELQAFEYLSGDLMKTGASLGYHDDLVMALALIADEINIGYVGGSSDDSWGYSA